MPPSQPCHPSLPIYPSLSYTANHLTLLSLHTAVPSAPPPPRAADLFSPAHLLRPRRSRPPATGAGFGGSYRDDCWTDAATAALIDAWGRRFLQLNRGCLRLHDWQAVADAVAAAGVDHSAPKSYTQCKNRIDTVKKKYKAERARLDAAAAGDGEKSSWPFFDRLDALLNPVHDHDSVPVPARSPPRTLLNLHIPKRHRSSLPASKKFRISPPSPVYSASAGEFADGSRKHSERRAEVSSGFEEVAQALLRFGEVYEKLEKWKQQQAMEMEKQRMVFVTELDLQRMQFYMKTQMELSQLNS